MSEPRYAHEQTEAALANLTSDATDAFIANLIADYFTRARTPPFVLTINHNGRVAPCPLKIDKVMTKACMVTHVESTRAHAWIVEALMRGYEVTTGTRRGQETQSIAAQRRAIEHRVHMAEWREKRKTNPAIDDDIPF